MRKVSVCGLNIESVFKELFPMLLVTGLTIIIAGQAFLNIAGVTKFLPLTGITLPFVSHGGSSLVTGFIGLGIILAVTDGKAKKVSKKKIKLGEKV